MTITDAPVYARSLARLLGAGLIGTVTHVSCVDRRARVGASPAQAGPGYVQLLAYGADHLAWLRELLAVDPVRVMARCAQLPWRSEGLGDLTEAFLEMASGVHVQYHGSLASLRDHHELWIDGERGALRTNGRLVWFRRTGWLRFVPVAGSPRRWTDDPSVAAVKAADRRRRLDAFNPEETAGGDDRWPLAIAEAVIRADRSGRPVAVTEPSKVATAIGASA